MVRQGDIGRTFGFMGKGKIEDHHASKGIVCRLECCERQYQPCKKCGRVAPELVPLTDFGVAKMGYTF